MVTHALLTEGPRFNSQHPPDRRGGTTQEFGELLFVSADNVKLNRPKVLLGTRQFPMTINSKFSCCEILIAEHYFGKND